MILLRCFKSACCVALLVVAIAGCASRGTNLAASGKVKVEALPSPDLELSAPEVWQQGDGIYVHGTVKRKPAFDGPVKNHVDLWFLSADRRVLHAMELALSPNPIPTKGNRQASYSVHYSYLPPAGTIVMVGLANDRHAGQSGGSRGSAGMPANTTGGGPGSGSIYTATPGTPGRMGTPGTPRGGGRR